VLVYFLPAYFRNLISSRISDKRQPFDLILLTTIVSAFLILGITFVTRPVIIILLIGVLGISQGLYYPSQNTWQTFICSVRNQSSFFGIGIFAEGISATIAQLLWMDCRSNQLTRSLSFSCHSCFISFALFLILRF